MSVVTGAFSYTGKYITRRLLSMGVRVRTLTSHPARSSPFGYRVAVAPLDFDDPDKLATSLQGADTLYNTYWIRFARGSLTFDRAVENLRTLIGAAERAGVKRVVHISITNASSESPLPYFQGKGQVEEAVRASGMSYAILRPALVFGKEDILVNNIAWALRRLPLFGVFGSGEYRVQPIYVDDLAAMAVGAGQDSDNHIVDAVGPAVYKYEEFVRLIAAEVGSRTRIVHVNPRIGFRLTQLLGYLLRDVVLTRNEIEGLMADLLVSKDRPTVHTAFSEWLAENAGELGRSYASEVARHYR